MRALHSLQRRRWVLLVLVLGLAGAVWGAYAWRFTGGWPRLTGGQTENTATLSTEAGDISSSRTDASEAEGDSASSGNTPSAFVSVNAPPSVRDRIEIDLGAGSTAHPNVATPPTAKQPQDSPVKPSSSSAKPASPSAREQIEAARAASARGDLLVAREAYSAAFDGGLDPTDAETVRSELERLADAFIFSRARIKDDPLTSEHVVGVGDNLATIARQNKVPEALLCSINGISDANRILLDQPLKLIRGPFRAVIDKSEHRMNVRLDLVMVRSFRVGLGSGGGTPTGVWKVRNKLQNPDWTDPVTHEHYPADDPENPIGEYWIGLEGISGEAAGKLGFGIHGTIDPGSIGQDKSMGCIRLLADDVEFVYDLMVPGESTVEVVP